MCLCLSDISSVISAKITIVFIERRKIRENKINNLTDYISRTRLGEAIDVFLSPEICSFYLISLGGFLLSNDFLVSLDGLLDFGVVLGSLHCGLTSHFCFYYF